METTDLQIILRSNVPLIVLETYDELRAQSLVQKTFRDKKMPCWRWSITDGLQSLGFGLQLNDKETCFKPEDVLLHIKKHQTASAFVLCDLHPYLDEPKIVRLLKDIALNQQAAGHKVILLSHEVKLPPEVARYSATLAMRLPSEDEILSIIREEAKQWSRGRLGEKVRTDSHTLQKLVNNLKGLTHQDVRRLARVAITDDNAITENDLPAVSKAKFALLDMEGVLHFEFSSVKMNEVAGLNRLKSWLGDRKNVVVSSESSQLKDIPKGVMLFGVQGGGKSLAARAIAGIWGLPLLRLDMAGLFNKYVGETERNLREALKLADTMAPCILWIDEIEKGLAQDNGESATSKRLLGSLLTWMAERDSRAFIVATSNDISALPPELLRKGRFDEIFFVDLPCPEARRQLFQIHMEKRELLAKDFALNHLIELTEGFTGAEIEQAVVQATYSAAAADRLVSGLDLENAVTNTRPLSLVMAEQVEALRRWAAERAVPAD